MHNSLLHNLNSKQIEAVQTTDGPILIIAGPGSGKTKVLTHRIAQLVNTGTPAKNILAVTFTNKAAQEIKERLAAILNSKMELPTAGTFHSICALILRHELGSHNLNSLTSNFTIYDDEDSRSLIKKILKELQLSEEYFKPGTILENISQAKTELINENDYAQSATDYYPQTISKIYHLYQTSLRKANAVDFDDLIFLTIELFRHHPQALEKYQEKFKYILIDEYQDTNHAQYTLINLLAQKYENICAVGDEAQSIYGWRGADVRNILNFKHDYPETKIIFLEQNYRSTQVILAAADAVISQNTHKFDKKLWTANEFGQPINFYCAENEREEADFIAREISSLKYYDNLQLKDFAVFYRTNAQSRAVEEAFLRHKLPYKIIGGIKFYGRREIKDLIAYLRFIQNSHDKISLARIINTPPRGIGNKTQEIILNNTLEMPADIPKAKAFFDLMEELRSFDEKATLSQLLNKIIQQTNYETYLKQTVDKNKEGDSRLENIQELFTVVKTYDHLPWPEAINVFLEQTALLASSDEIDTQNNLVNLMTLHCAKGLEFPVVFITGCEEGIFPYTRSYLDPFELEEERRLCYVGLTRAKKRLYLTHARQRHLFGMIYANEPSRFLSEIPQELTKKKLL